LLAPRKPAVRKPKAPKRPLFPPTPLDEMAGVLLVSVGVLATLLAVKPQWMGGLAPVGEGLQLWLGSGFLMAGAFIVLLGLEAFTPHQALALPQLLLALGGLFACLEVYADLMGGQGGIVGRALSGFLQDAIGRPGAWTVTVAATLCDLQWMTRVSLRGPARLLTLPLRLSWRALRGLGHVAQRAWDGYQQRREEAADLRAAQVPAASIAAAPSRSWSSRAPPRKARRPRKRARRSHWRKPTSSRATPSWNRCRCRSLNL
jgi:hypothetical protein